MRTVNHSGKVKKQQIITETGGRERERKQPAIASLLNRGRKALEVGRG